MHFHNYIFIGIFFLFLFSSKTRLTAFVLLFVYFVYFAICLQFHGLDRYAAIGTLELIAGYSLLKIKPIQDLLIAKTYFIAVFVNVIGGCLYQGYYPPIYYDNMCISIMVIQTIILAHRILKSGKLINRCNFLCPIFGPIISYINKRILIVQSKTTKSETHRGIKK